MGGVEVVFGLAPAGNLIDAVGEEAGGRRPALEVGDRRPVSGVEGLSREPGEDLRLNRAGGGGLALLGELGLQGLEG